MHKQSIEDYKNVIDHYLNDENGKITDSTKFKKAHSEQFYLIFDNIAEEFQNRLRTLKCELIKKLNIKELEIKKLQGITEEKTKIKKSQVITEENESESESDNESNN